ENLAEILRSQGQDLPPPPPVQLDLMVQDGLDILLIEVKSGQTVDGSFLDPLLEGNMLPWRMVGTGQERIWNVPRVTGTWSATARRVPAVR
ncbi:MAG TPA: hypothetical protein PKK12_00795, partial [Candidatus Aminicenantes bacterium]|nr:hypothetical protein [Candidatus Aminicenantes bacterium]